LTPQLLRARWVLPVSTPPVRDGWILVEDGRIKAVGGATDRTWRDAAQRVEERDLGAVAVMPGLVNAHTHLELSWMHGRIPPAERLPDWIRCVIGLRREPGPDDVQAVERAIDGLSATGTALVGDVTNTLISVGPLRARRMPGVVFNELIGFRSARASSVADQAIHRLETETWADDLRPSLAAHAPYSVSPALFRAIAAARGRYLPAPCSVHLAESREELEFLKHGTGPWRALLDDVGAWDASWSPAASDPVAYIDRLGFVDSSLLVVHGVWLTDGELARLAAVGATVVTCPRSNIRTGAGEPPIMRFYASGVRVAIGTDSLAGVDDLNLFSELRELRRLAPRVAAARLLQSATRDGAHALGFGEEYGTTAPGQRARLVAVGVPSGESDVEEYLVNGVGQEQIRPLVMS
jgi:cytosine/adenosine deaminase-related metal-dependent hydrolase